MEDPGEGNPCEGYSVARQSNVCRDRGAYTTAERAGMSAKVDLYNNSYGNYERDVYRDVRVETYGADFGQTSWVNTEESHELPHLLDLTPGCSVLEIGSGSGRYAL